MEVDSVQTEVTCDIRLWVQSSGLSCEDAQDKDDWRLRIKGAYSWPGFPGNWPLNGMCVVTVCSIPTSQPPTLSTIACNTTSFGYDS